MPLVEKNGDREMGKQRAERMGHRVERDGEGGGLEGGSGTRRRPKRKVLWRGKHAEVGTSNVELGKDL